MLFSGASCFLRNNKTSAHIFYFRRFFLIRAKSHKMPFDSWISNKIFHANCAFVVTLTAPRLHSVSKCRHAVFLLFLLAFIHHQNPAFALHLKMPCSVEGNNKTRLLSSNYSKTQLYVFLRLPVPARFGAKQKKEIIRNNNYYKATKCLAELCRSPMSECVRGSERASRVARYVVCRSLSLLHVAPSRRLFFVRSLVYTKTFSLQDARFAFFLASFFFLEIFLTFSLFSCYFKIPLRTPSRTCTQMNASPGYIHNLKPYPINQNGRKISITIHFS